MEQPSTEVAPEVISAKVRIGRFHPFCKLFINQLVAQELSHSGSVVKASNGSSTIRRQRIQKVISDVSKPFYIFFIGTMKALCFLPEIIK